MTIEKFTYIDLFAGCGGLSLGLHNAGWRGIFAIEKSPDAFLTLKYNLIDKKNHFDWPNWLDQTNLEIDEVIKKHKRELEALQGKVDMVVGGPPCQGFSTAGRRKEDDVRNRLINSYLDFINLVKPKIIFFENVKGFTLKFKKNKTKGLAYSEYVVSQLQSNGYKVTDNLVDFSKFGLPQKRTRFILIGIRDDIIQEKKVSADIFFKQIIIKKREFLINKSLPLNPCLRNAISDLLKKDETIETPDRKNFYSGVYSPPNSRYQEYMRKDSSLEIPNSHSFAKHKPAIKKRFEQFIELQNSNKRISDKIKKKHNISKHTIVPLCAELKTPTLTTLPDDFIHYSEPRILTVREYARIQSFPDWFEFKGKYTTGGKLRTKQVPRYTQIGNAIPPLFGELSGNVLKYLLGNNE